MRHAIRLAFACAFLLLSACHDGPSSTPNQRQPGKPTSPAPPQQDSATSIANRMLVVDSHIELPFKLKREWIDVSGSTGQGQFDYPRAVQGGLNVPFMSIYTPASVAENGQAFQLADELIDIVENLVRSDPDKFALAYSTTAVQQNFQNRKISLAMGMENGAPLEGSIANLQHFYNRGIRYISLTGSKSNEIADSSYDTQRPWNGLSPFGESLIGAMNATGVMIDVSHLSEAAFYDVLSLSKTPVIASHSATRHFTPGFERNLSDEMLVALGNNRGVIQLSIGSNLISNAAHDNAVRRQQLIEQYLSQNGLSADSDEGQAAIQRIQSENPAVFATMNDVLNQVDYIVGLIGVDHVGIGTDFEGVGNTLPNSFKDVSDYPNFIEGLMGRGYTEAQIEKIVGGNLMRVWREAEAFAN